MQRFKLPIIITLMILLSALAVSSVGATVGPPLYNNGTFGCNAVSFSYSAVGSAVNFRVVDNSNTVVSNILLGQANGTHTMTLTLSPEQDPGTVLQIQHDYGGWTNFGPATACAGDAVVNEAPPPPRWEHFGGQGAYAAFRFVDDGIGNPVLVFLAVSDEGEGSILYFISSAMLEADYPCNGEVIELYRSDDGRYSLYRLPSCELQANVGPDAEGKTFVLGFGSIPPGDDVFSYSFFAGEAYLRWFEGDLLLS